MESRSAISFDGFIMDVIKNPRDGWDDDIYPFNLTAVKSWERLALHENVTFFVGENGSGKSTLIEALALAFGLNAEGGSRDHGFYTRQTHSSLHKHIRLVKNHRRPKNNYFLRAESLYSHASFVDDFANPNRYGGETLHQQSHGEGMMTIFWHRLSKDGFYILDEPEAALSPSRQLAFIARMHELVEQNCQFIIATHSPVLLAYPNAWIYEFTSDGVKRAQWDDLEHVDLTRQFLNHPHSFLSELMKDEE